LNQKKDILLKFNITEPLFLIGKVGAIAVLLVSVFVLIYQLSMFLKKFILKEKKLLTKEEKKVFIISFLVMLLVNVLWYSLVSADVIKDDILYSTDSYYVSFRMFSHFTWHLDFRHIFFSILTYPFYTLFKLASIIVPFSSHIYFIFLSMLQVCLLIYTAILLKRITKSKWMMYLYLCSFPTLFSGIIIEKFPLCVFLIVLFIYLCLSEKEDNEIKDFSLICSVGAITTSAVLGIWSSIKKGIEKINELIRVAVLFLAVSITLGKFNILTMIFDYARSFGDIGIINRIYGVTELFVSCLFAPLFKIKDNVFIWQNEANYLNILGAILFVLCIYSFIKNRKNKFAQICFSWICFALFLFLVMNWYCYEAPLFNLYFSWSILGLLFLLIEPILSKFKCKEFIWISFLIFMVAINSVHMIQILKFFMTF